MMNVTLLHAPSSPVGGTPILQRRVCKVAKLGLGPIVGHLCANSWDEVQTQVMENQASLTSYGPNRNCINVLVEIGIIA